MAETSLMPLKELKAISTGRSEGGQPDYQLEKKTITMPGDVEDELGAMGPQGQTPEMIPIERIKGLPEQVTEKNPFFKGKVSELHGVMEDPYAKPWKKAAAGGKQAFHYWDTLDRGLGMAMTRGDLSMGDLKKSLRGDFDMPSGKEQVIKFLQGQEWVDQEELKEHLNDAELAGLGVAYDVGISASSWITLGFAGVARLSASKGPQVLKSIDRVIRGASKPYKWATKKGFETLGNTSAAPIVNLYKYDRDFIKAIMESPIEDLANPKKAKPIIEKLLERSRLVEEKRFIRIKELEAKYGNKIVGIDKARESELAVIRKKTGNLDKEIQKVVAKRRAEGKPISIEELNNIKSGRLSASEADDLIEKTMAKYDDLTISAKRLEEAESYKLGGFESPYTDPFIGPQESMVPLEQRMVAGQQYMLSKEADVPLSAFHEYKTFISEAQKAGQLKQFEVDKVIKGMETIKAKGGKASVADIYELTSAYDDMIFSSAIGGQEKLTTRLPKAMIKRSRYELNKTITENSDKAFQQYAEIVKRSSNNIEIVNALRWKELSKGQIGGFVKLGKDIHLIKGIGASAMGTAYAYSQGSAGFGAVGVGTTAALASWFIGTRPSVWVKLAYLGKGGNAAIDGFLKAASISTQAAGKWMMNYPKMSAVAMLTIEAVVKKEIEADLNLEYGISSLDENWVITNPEDRQKYARHLNKQMMAKDVSPLERAKAVNNILKTGELYQPPGDNYGFTNITISPELMGEEPKGKPPGPFGAGGGSGGY